MSNLASHIENRVAPLKSTMVLPQAEYEGLHELEDEFDVVCYQVHHNSEGLSPLLESREQAQAFVAEIKQAFPAAKIGKYTFEYSSANDRDRKEILDKIVKVGGSK